MSQSTSPQPDAEHLLAGAYDDLRAMAAEFLRNERPGHTLQPTALVHEAYLRMAEFTQVEWQDKTHFCRTAAGVIRRLLVDCARARATKKRGHQWKRVTVSGLDASDDGSLLDLLALDEALNRLAQQDERKCRVVELKYFGGLTIAETAAALQISTTTVEDDWAFARCWLKRELGEQA